VKVRKHLRQLVDTDKISRAIDSAQSRSTGRILVSIAPHFWGDVRRAAEEAFCRHRLHQELERNAVYFFVVPSRRQFTVLGGAGIHERLGQEYWERLAAALGEKARTENITAALVDGIADVGDRLSEHFPRGPER